MEVPSFASQGEVKDIYYQFKSCLPAQNGSKITSGKIKF